MKRFDSQVTPGVYQLTASSLGSLKGQPAATITATNATSLVLIHGTFSTTAGTFGKLWTDHPQLVRVALQLLWRSGLCARSSDAWLQPYRERHHPRSVAPDGTRLHLLTHSRGGLVAEVLARVCADPGGALDTFTAGDDAQREELRELAAIVQAKGLHVERVVRVACPARGTLLASKRLDAYVSVVKWALELAGLPVVPELVEFLGEVARRRARPDLLPGLAAQIPDSPLIQWLHSVETPLAGDLRVVAGDLQGDSVVSWVKTLLADAFYWTDNDLVVQTRSMYGGSPRASDSTFLLDQGGRVSHFNYFSSPTTATAVVDALTQSTPANFHVIGPLSWGGASSTGTRAALVQRSAAAAAELPARVRASRNTGQQSEGRRRSRLAWMASGQRVQPPRLRGRPTGFGRARWSDRSLLRRPLVVSVVGPRRHSVRLRLAASDRGRGESVGGRRGGRARRARGVGSAGALHRPLHGRARCADDAGGEGEDVDANDGRRRRSRLDAGNSQRRLLGADAGDVGRRHLRQHAHRRRRAVSRGRDASTDRAVPRTRAAPGRTARRSREASPVAGTRRRGSGGGSVAQYLALAAGAVGSTSVGDPESGRPRSRGHRCDGIWTGQRDTSLGAFASKLLLVVGKAAITPAGYEMGPEGLVYLNASDQGDGRVLLQSAVLPGVATWTLEAEHGCAAAAQGSIRSLS